MKPKKLEMNKFLWFFLFITISGFNAFSQDEGYIENNMELEKNKFYHLFGNNVVLRNEAGLGSDVLDTLSIDSKIQILENTKKNVDYLGRKATWYKVKFGSKKGYILDEFIALDRKEFNSDIYLVQISTYSLDSSIIRIRLIDKTRKIHVASTKMRTFYFSTNVSDNKGLSDVSSIFSIHFLAEACGVNGGEKVFFHVHDTLKLIADLSSISDAGVFGFEEQLIFPKDEKGVENTIIYNSELVQYLNEELTWEEIKIVNRQMNWENGSLTPDVQTVQKEVMELEKY